MKARPRTVRWWGQVATIVVGTCFACVAAVYVALHAAHVDDPAVSSALELTMTLLVVMSIARLLRCFSSTRRLRDLLLLVAVVMVWLRDLPFATVPAVAGLDSALTGLDAQLALQPLVSLSFLVAAVAPARILKTSARRPLLIIAVSVIAVLGITELLDWALGVRPLIGALNSAQVLAAKRSPGVLVTAVISSTLLTAAGAGFLCWREQAGSALFAASSLTLAIARLQLIAVPVASASWLTFGDGLRLLAYGLIFWGATRSYAGARRDVAERGRNLVARKLRAAAEAAAAGERHRLAQDLHDGLAQDLAVIALHAQGLESELGQSHAVAVAVAARHALGISRGTITSLSGEGASSLEQALRQMAGELAAKYEGTVGVTIEPGWDGVEAQQLELATREHMVRIARESVTNALARGQAHNVEITVGVPGRAIRLAVADDGRGFASGGTEPGHGFGIRMMRARARSLGGWLNIRPASGAGTEVELIVPFRARAGAASEPVSTAARDGSPSPGSAQL